MHWYTIFAVVYFALLAVVLTFLAGATRLANEAEAKDRMRPHRNGPPRSYPPKRYRDAA
jgi:hypothetical protein